jgi:tetratricopeptide (TPR) repeat protein
MGLPIQTVPAHLGGAQSLHQAIEQFSAMFSWATLVEAQLGVPQTELQGMDSLNQCFQSFGAMGAAVPASTDAGYAAMPDFAKDGKICTQNEDLYGIASRGRLLHENGRPEAAQRIFEGLIILAPNEASFHTGLGAVYQRQEDLVRARQEYDRALALDDQDLAALCNRAEVLLQQGLIEAAAKDLQCIAGLDPKGRQGHSQRARGIALALRAIVKRLQEPQPPPAG